MSQCLIHPPYQSHLSAISYRYSMYYSPHSLIMYAVYQYYMYVLSVITDFSNFRIISIFYPVLLNFMICWNHSVFASWFLLVGLVPHHLWCFVLPVALCWRLRLLSAVTSSPSYSLTGRPHVFFLLSY